jgi:hypothetical protein
MASRQATASVYTPPPPTSTQLQRGKSENKTAHEIKILFQLMKTVTACVFTGYSPTWTNRKFVNTATSSNKMAHHIFIYILWLVTAGLSVQLYNTMDLCARYSVVENLNANLDTTPWKWRCANTETCRGFDFYCTLNLLSALDVTA